MSSTSVLILGAGFSAYAGMPLQKDFTKALLGGRGEATGTSGQIVQYLRTFVNRAFDHSTSAGAEFWPDLEDIFTCVDLSANTGHNLGATYPPAELRTVRRALLYRITIMLRERHREARGREKWRALRTFMKTLNIDSTTFISTNWDTVVEDMLTEAHHIAQFKYKCDAVCASLDSDQMGICFTHQTPTGCWLRTKDYEKNMAVGGC